VTNTGRKNARKAQPKDPSKAPRPESRSRKTDRAAAPAVDQPLANKSISLTDRAYAAIKEKILTLYFLPGQYLNESAICELLEMGRTPVHQALQRLQVDGLIDIIPRKGVIIQPDSISQIIDIIDARLVVEVEIARLAALRATPSDVQELNAILDHLQEGHHGGGQIDAFVECDRAFHLKITHVSGNTVLGDFARLLHERSTRSWYLHLWQTLDSNASNSQHRKIVKAFKANDGEMAAQAMREHLSSLRERLSLLQRQSFVPGRQPMPQPKQA